MAKRLAKKVRHGGKNTVAENQLILELLDTMAVQTENLDLHQEQLADPALLMAKETWAKIETAFNEPTDPKEFSEEAFRLIGEYRVLLGECEWSCNLPQNNGGGGKEEVHAEETSQLPVLVSSVGT